MKDESLKGSPGAGGAELTFVARESGWAGFLGIAGAGLRYVNTMILTRVLGTAAYGLFALANTVITVLSTPASMGLQTSTVHFVAASAGRSQWGRLRWVIRASFWLVLFSSLAWTALVFFSATWSSEALFHKEGLVLPLAGLALSLPLLGLTNVCAGSLQGLRKIRAKVILDRVAQPLLFSVFLVAGWFYLRTMGFVIGCFLVSTFLVLIWGAAALARSMKSVPVAEGPAVPFWRELVVFSTPVMFLNLLNFLVLWSDVLVMGIYRTAAEVGIYHIASRLAVVVNIPLEALNSSLAPNFSGLHSRGEMEGLKRIYHTSTRWIFLLSAGVFLLLVFGGRPVLWAFGKDFQAGFLAMCLLAAGQLISSSMGANGTLITQTGFPVVNLVNVVFLGIVNLGLTFLLVPRYGATGAASAAAVSLGLVNIARSIEIWCIFKISPWDRTFLKPFLAFVLALAGGGSGWWWGGPVAALVIGPPVFVLFWWLAGPESEDLELLRKARKKF